MQIPQHFSNQLSLSQQVLFALSILHKATVHEIEADLAELRGTASEEGVAELTSQIHEALDELHRQGMVKQVTDADKQTRYFISKQPDETIHR